MKLTSSQEEYLKTIYYLSCISGAARITDIAQKLNITKPSVNKAIKTLSELDLVNYKIYSDVTLTKIGEDIARVITKKYDIVKMFLTEVLEVDSSQAEDDARAIKSVISKETEEKLEKYIIKVLKLEELECGYNINNEKCRKCARVIKKGNK